MIFERRLKPRYRVALPIIADEVPGITFDISVSGARFVASKAFAIGALIEVAVEMSDGQLNAPIVIEARARVIWRSPTADGQIETAVQFEEIRFAGAERNVAKHAGPELDPRFIPAQ